MPSARPPRKPQLVNAVATAGPLVHPFDLAYGTDTGGLIPAEKLLTGHPSDRHVTAYYGIAPSILRSILDIWLSRTAPPFSVDRYTFVDIGAGKGRAVLIAAQCPFQEVLGVELNPNLAAIAQRNIEIATAHDLHAQQLLSPIRLLQQDALALHFPDTPTLVFLFHPFEAPLLQKLLRRIEAQFGRRPAQLDILYINAEHAPILDTHPAFRKLWQGAVPMSTEDHVADLQEIAGQAEYGSTGDEQCAIYRYVGRSTTSPS